MDKDRYTLDDEQKLILIGKALSSEMKIEILRLLKKQNMSINDIAKKTGAPASSTALNIKALEEAGIVKTELVKANRGTVKICSLNMDEINITFDMLEEADETDVIDMPIGNFVDYKAIPTCGIVNEKGNIDEEDEPRCFYSPLRATAKLIWTADGYFEYRFPNHYIQNKEVKAIEISAELCSEAKDYNMDYPSDITLWVNGIDAGTWECPSDYGGRRGKLNPEWWPDKNTQYGKLKTWSISEDGTYLDYKRVNEYPIGRYGIKDNDYISVRIGIKDDAKHHGGINLFGDAFGDYKQNISMKFIYKSKSSKDADKKRRNRMKERLVEKFYEIFGRDGEAKSYFAPGRVNLIGEHTDYNGGHVFPCALTIGTYLIARKRNDNKLRFFSENFESLGVIESSLSELVYSKEANWTNYPKGVMWAFGEKGYAVNEGFDILLFGNIPNGSGLSSSASVEVATAVMLKDMLGYDIDMVNVSLICQFSENKFNGVNCGIMDQFAIAMGKKDNAIFLDTSDLSYEYAPIVLDGMKVIIACSNKKRGLGDSKYNERRSECETALEEIRKVKDIKSLGELTNEEFESVKDAIKDPVRIKRARHAVYENQRTIEAVKALKANDIERFGKLMIASHESLRDDYEVTGKELDTLVDAALKVDGVIGSRMTGAGFGGCTVSIVKEEAVDDFIEKVGKEYLNTIGYAADFYVVDIGDGAGLL